MELANSKMVSGLDLVAPLVSIRDAVRASDDERSSSRRSSRRRSSERKSQEKESTGTPLALPPPPVQFPGALSTTSAATPPLPPVAATQPISLGGQGSQILDNDDELPMHDD